MNVGNIVRRLTGAVENAAVWGVTWSTLTFVTIIGLRTFGVVVLAAVTLFGGMMALLPIAAIPAIAAIAGEPATAVWAGVDPRHLLFDLNASDNVGQAAARE